MGHKNKPEQRGQWQFNDVLIVFVLWQASLLVGRMLLHLFLADEYVRLHCFRYVSALITYGIPVWWLRYTRMSWRSLGLGSGRLPWWGSVGAGVFGALIITAVSTIVLHENYPVDFLRYSQKEYLVMLALFPFTIAGFSLALLIPFSEEVLFRGFLYDYLRRRFGVALGLVFQALFFAFAHGWIFSESQFFQVHAIQGFGFGLLYQATGTLLAPTICHGVVNVLAILLPG